MLKKGESRIRLVNQRVIDEYSLRYPTMPFDEKRDLCLSKGLEFDSGWNSNVITDFCRRSITNGQGLDSSVNIFIHQGRSPGLARLRFLHNTYASQTPNQVRSVDSSNFDTSTLVQIRTVQFPAPSVARIINSVGLTDDAAADANNVDTGAIFSILAYTLLSSAIVQGTSQAADVQYRVTFSLDV